MQFERRARISSTLSMTPLIDVVFLLLVFFMLTSTIKKEDQLELVLPSASATTATPKEPLTIELNAEGDVFIHEKQIDKGALEAMLRDTLDGEHPPVLIRASKEAALSHFISVLDVLKKLGVDDAGIAVDRGRQ